MLTWLPLLRSFFQQAEHAPAAELPGARVKLGTRRKLVVLRASRFGAQHASIDDAVAASLASRPGCAAAIDLQRLVPAVCGDAADMPVQQPAPAVQPAAMTGDNCAQQQQQQQPPPPPPQQAAAAAVDDARRDGGSAGEADGAEAGSLSSYLSSWFGGSPSKPAVKSAPIATSTQSAPGAAQQQGSGNVSLSSSPQPPPGLARAGSSLKHAALDVGAASNPATPTLAAAATTTAAHPTATTSAMAALVEKLEEQLAPLLPSVGVVHLGLELAGAAGMVLRWRQSLQVVVEPSEPCLLVLGSCWLSCKASAFLTCSVVMVQARRHLPC